MNSRYLIIIEQFGEGTNSPTRLAYEQQEDLFQYNGTKGPIWDSITTSRLRRGTIQDQEFNPRRVRRYTSEELLIAHLEEDNLNPRNQ